MITRIFYRGEEIALTARVSGEGIDLSEFSISVRLHIWGSPYDLLFTTPPDGGKTEPDNAAAPAAGRPCISVRGADVWVLGIPAELTAGLAAGVCTAVTSYTHLTSGTVAVKTDAVFRIAEPDAAGTSAGPCAVPAAAGVCGQPSAASPIPLSHTFDLARHVGLDGLSAYEIWLAEGGSGTRGDFLNYLREPADEAAAAAENAVREATAAAAEALAARDSLAEAIDKKADKTELDKKADLSALNLKADKAALELKADRTELAAKADRSALDLKADKTELASKADAAALSALAPLDAAGVYIEPSRLDPRRPLLTGLSFPNASAGAEWDGSERRLLSAFTLEVLAELRDSVSASVGLLQVNDWMALYYRGASHLLAMSYMDADEFEVTLNRLGGILTPGLNHIVAAWGPEDSIVRCWVNGSLRGEAAAPDMVPVLDRVWMCTSGQPNPRPVHHARIFDYALDAGGVAALWNGGDPASYRPPTPAPSDTVPGRCISEYVPPGLTDGSWRDTAGGGRDLRLRGDFNFVYSPARFPDPLTGSGAPQSPPAFAGQRYVDAAGSGVWIAAGTASAADWKQLA